MHEFLRSKRCSIEYHSTRFNGKNVGRNLASQDLTSRLQTFETEMLAKDENFTGLARVNRELIGRTEALDSQYRVVLDMDSTGIPVYGGRSTAPMASGRPALSR